MTENIINYCKIITISNKTIPFSKSISIIVSKIEILKRLNKGAPNRNTQKARKID